MRTIEETSRFRRDFRREKRGLTASPADKERKALGVKRIVGQELELLAFHFAGRPATYAPHFELEVYARVAAREVAHATDRVVVPAVM